MSVKKIIEHIDSDYTEPVREPLWKHIYLSKPLLEIVQLDSFQKLNDIKQLGPTYLLYPGATHSRFNHSLGVFHIAKQMVTHLIKRPNLPPVTLPGVKAFLCAALLHDLGHYPFAHSLKDLDVMEHEILTAQTILSDEISGVIRDALNIEPELVAAIIDCSIDYKGEENVRFFQSLLSGVLDPDKLDYLNRDAYYCGVPYGLQDVAYILNEIYPHNEMGIAISARGITSVESILFSKYLMYKTVYWHKTTRIATSMIKKAVFMGLDSGIITPENLYGLTDNSFFLLLSKYDFKPFQLAAAVSSGRLFTCLHRVPYDENNGIHKKLDDMKFRVEFEKTVSEYMNETLPVPIGHLDVVIDLPEHISFESNLPVYNADSNEFLPFAEADSVFDIPVVKKFTQSLRYIILSVNPGKNDPNDLFRIDFKHIFS